MTQLEIAVDGDESSVATAALEAGVAVVQAAVREWAAELRKAVADQATAPIPLDPPTQAQTPRSAALITDEEAMSAGGAAALDDANVEDVPRADEEGEGEEEPPFTEEEVVQMVEEVAAKLRESFPGEEGERQVAELDEELGKTDDLQEQGRMLVDVMDYLQNPPEEEGQEEGGEEDDLPYPGEAGLEELWKEVCNLCNEDDIDRLENELKGKAGEEQWNILLDVRDYLLNGDEEEQAAYGEWQPSLGELEKEWKLMLARVPADEVDEVQVDWQKASEEDKKRMVWDVRKFLEQQDAEQDGSDAPGANPPPKGPPKGPAMDDPEMGRNEVRRRGARRGPDYEANYEYGFDGDKGRDGGEWDEYYNKEVKRAQKGKTPLLLVGGVTVLLGTLAVVLTATAFAEEDESVFSSAMRLLRLS